VVFPRLPVELTRGSVELTRAPAELSEESAVFARPLVELSEDAVGVAGVDVKNNLCKQKVLSRRTKTFQD